MKKIEWVLVFLFAIVVWILQVILILFFGVGLALNRALDLIANVLLIGYFQLRGVSMVNTRRLLLFLVSITAEVAAVGISDWVPIMAIDVILTWLTVRAEEKPDSKLGKIGAKIKMVNTLADIKQSAKVPPKIPTGGTPPPLPHIAQNPPPLNQNGVRLPTQPLPEQPSR